MRATRIVLVLGEAVVRALLSANEEKARLDQLEDICGALTLF
jgi:hypothetical protein